MAAKLIPPKPLSVQVGDAIRRARKQLGITQDELAYQAGIHRAYMGVIERGEQNITLNTLVLVCGPLRTKPSVLLDEVGI